MSVDSFTNNDLAAIERSTKEIGRYLFGHLNVKQPSVFDRRWWDDRIMAWAMEDESVKVQMFRFIDVLPMLHDNVSVTRHLQEYFHEVRRHLPAAARLGLAVASPESLRGRALAIIARRNAAGHAKRFIAGTNTTEVLAAAMRQRKLKRAFTLDILGEAVISQSEADHFLQQYLDLIAGVAPTVNSWPEVPQIDQGILGPLPRTNISIKLSALDSHFSPVDPDGTLSRVAPRLRKLLRAAKEHQAFINVDMESYYTKDLTLWIFQQVLMEDEFRHIGDVGIVIQCYLRDAEHDLQAMCEWAKQRGKPVWVRLVKGAYWDYETVRAEQFGWPIPVFQHKPETDANFEKLTRYLLKNFEHLRPAVASHNIRSLAHTIAVGRHLGMPPLGYELQMLYGMGDAEKQVLVDLGHRLRVYMPYGELIPGMAYLVRRLLENTSNDSFLKASFTEQVDPELLLLNPLDTLNEQEKSTMPFARSNVTPDALSVLKSFRNEPDLDFSRRENRQGMRDALDQVTANLEQDYPLLIGGDAVDTEEKIVSLNPSNTEQIIGTCSVAAPAEVSRAVAAAKQAFPAWAALTASERAAYLRAAADVMQSRRLELAAWEIFECGKTWLEADADVTEAIDFCRYYAMGAEFMGSEHGVNVPGEENRFLYVPRGVATVIAPWNFPLAILTGMTAAALVTGNTVIMKPAEQAVVVAAKLAEILHEAGLPAGVANFLPGHGETAGAALVEHPDVALIAFTGSRQVGLAIHAKAAEVSAAGTSKMVKKVIAEMGGKNAIIIDNDADLDEAVQGVVKSAFGFQGQKCSACSRAVVLDGVYDTFLHRLIEATRSLKVGPASEPGTDIGPVIDEESRTKVRSYLELGRKEGREVLQLPVGDLADVGYFVEPSIFADVPADARLAQEEIFGPVLAVIRVKNLDEAIAVLNNVDYALTGGIFSRSPANLDRACRELQVGNLYLNRPITGALVGRQPFGGFKMSGIGSQAGGPDYLLQFVLPRTITENTLRRGFAPPAEES